MADRTGTLERIAVELGDTLGLLSHLLAREEALETLAQFGLRFPPALLEDSGFDAARQATADAAAALGPALAALATAIEDEDPVRIVARGLEVLQQARVTIQSFPALASALEAAAGALPEVPAGVLAGIVEELPRKLLDLLVVQQLDTEAAAALGVLGLVDRTFVPADPAVPASEDHETATLRFDRLGGLLSAPAQHFQDVYGWGSPGFDGVALLSALRDLLVRLGMPALFRPATATSPAALEAFALDLTHDPTLDPPGLRVDVVMPVGGVIDETVTLPHPAWTVTVTASGTLAVGTTGQLRPPFDLAFSSTSVLSGGAGLVLRGPTEPFVLIGQAGGSRLEVSGVEVALGLDFLWNAAASRAEVVPGIHGKIDRGKLVIDGGQGDGFVSSLLRSVAMQAEFGLAFGWSQTTGLHFEGSAALEIGVPVHLRLGLLDISTAYLILSVRDGAFPLELSLDMAARLGPLSAVVSRLGAEVELSFPEGGGNVGPADLAFAFKPPSGVGLSVDLGFIGGGGFLRRDPQTGEYAGAIELVLGEFLNLKAIGIISTRSAEGGTGFSLLIIITAEFGPGLQIGFGFTLLAVGGLLGLNRTMRLDALAEGIRTGSASSVLFPRDVVANAPRIISDLRRIFPPERNKFLIGPMAKLAWGTPTLFTLSLGIVIEIPGNIAIVGVLRVALPHEEEPLVVVQVSFLGAIEFDKKRLWFFATLFESRVLYVTLEGEMGALAAFGEDGNLLASVGGFHPRFQPPPMPFPTPRPLVINILNEDKARVRLTGYLAITPNTLQFGAGLDLFFGFSRFSVQGHLAFDALLQRSPFHFIVEISGSVSLKAFGVDVFTIRLRLTLEGPTPYRAKGRGGISFFFFSISADFDRTWGDDRDTSLPPIDVVPLLEAELAKPNSWRALLPPGGQLLVSLRAVNEAANLVLHPVGKLRVSQMAVPLGLTLDRVGSQKPQDANRFTLRVLGGGLAAAGEARESFAPGQFQDLDDASRLSRPSYESLPGGLELAPAGAARTTSRVVRRVVRYEQHLIDTAFRRFVRFVSFLGSLFAHFLTGASVGKSPLSRKHRQQRQPFPAGERVTVKPEGWVVAFQASNQPVAALGLATFASAAEARQHLQDQQARDPRAASMHVIPADEAAA